MTPFGKPSRIPLYCKSANRQQLSVEEKKFVNKIRRKKQEVN